MCITIAKIAWDNEIRSVTAIGYPSETLTDDVVVPGYASMLAELYRQKAPARELGLDLPTPTMQDTLTSNARLTSGHEIHHFHGRTYLAKAE